MTDENGDETQLQGLLDRLAAGDETAIEEVAAITHDRVLRLARKLLGQNKALARWESAEDISQNAMIRLCRALKTVPPKTERDFINLAALQIRRELIDLYRHHFGPEGHATFHSTVPTESDRYGQVVLLYEQIVNSEGGPAEKFDEKELRALVNELDQEHRAVFVLLYFLEMEQTDVAKKLELSVATVKRRWAEARSRLETVVGDWEPYRKKRWWQLWQQ